MVEKRAPFSPASLDVVYQQYFGLKENPFSIAPDPHYFYISEKHREALAHLMYGFSSDGGFVLLTGDVGTGKTTVCRRMLEQMPEGCDVAFILYPKLTSEELLATICDEFGMACPEGTTSSKIYVSQIYGYLVRMHEQGKRAVLIIEEAQNLTDDVLEQVRLLTNLETSKRKLLQVIMLGQPELRQRLAMPHLRQLSQRITARYHLSPLSWEEMDGYVHHRLAVAGFSRGRLFSRPVLKTLFRLTDGVPRLVNVICDRALMGAYIQGRDRVDKKTLAAAAREVRGTDGRRWRLTKPYVALPLWSFAVLCVVFVFVFYLRSSIFPAGGPRKADHQVTEAAAIVQPAEKVLPDQGALKGSESAGGKLDATPGWEKAATTKTAYATLFREWRTTFNGDAGLSVCSQAGKHGLECLEATDSLDTLRRLNRPAVLRLIGEKGSTRYATLTALDGERATLVVSDATVVVDIQELSGRWLGEYLLLWRKPPGYDRRLKSGESAPLLAWVDKQLSEAQGRAGDAAREGTPDDDLAKRVKEFQALAGLIPDGKIGPKTLICLTDAANNDDPSLRKAKGGR